MLVSLQCTLHIVTQVNYASPALSYSSLRSSTTGVLLINLCSALIALNVSFIISTFVQRSPEACAAFSAVFHCLVLVSSFAFTTMSLFRAWDPSNWRKLIVGFAILADWGK